VCRVRAEKVKGDKVNYIREGEGCGIKQRGRKNETLGSWKGNKGHLSPKL